MAQSREEILARVIEIVADTLEVDPESLSEDTAYDSLDADSLDLLELVTSFEDEFDARIPDDELSGIKTIRQSVDLIMAAGA